MNSKKKSFHEKRGGMPAFQRLIVNAALALLCCIVSVPEFVDDDDVREAPKARELCQVLTVVRVLEQGVLLSAALSVDYIPMLDTLHSPAVLGPVDVLSLFQGLLLSSRSFLLNGTFALRRASAEPETRLASPTSCSHPPPA